MTKEQANDIKKIINSDGIRWTTYFNSKNNELRVTIAEWCDCDEEDKERIEFFKRNQYAKVLNKISANGIRPKFRTETKRYQGFINCFYIVFE